MRRFFTALGVITFAFAVLGAIGPFDFRLCFGPKGYCNKAPPLPST